MFLFHTQNRNLCKYQKFPQLTLVRSTVSCLLKNEVEVSHNKLQFQNWPTISAHSPAGLMYIEYVFSDIGSWKIVETVNYIQFWQGIWSLAQGKQTDFSILYIKGKMNRHIIWLKLNNLSCCTLLWFWQIKYSSQWLDDS